MRFLLRPSHRRRKIRNRILLALLVAAVIAAGVIDLSAGIRRELNQAIMRNTGGRAETTLRDTIDKLFEPVEGHLSIVKRCGERGTLDLTDHRALNDRFVPTMDQSARSSILPTA
jgi:hypothetical protein